MFTKLRYSLRALFQRTKMESDLEDELRFHLEKEIEENIKKGMTPQEGRRTAQLNFGGVERFKEECRDERGVNLFETLAQDVRYGFRVLLKKPLFTAIVILTLAIGIGANTAIFSVVNTVLFSPLPYPKPEQLAMVWLENPRKNVHEGLTSYADFEDWRTQNRVFESLSAFTNFSMDMAGAGEPERLHGARVSANFLSLMKINPMLGRGFLPEEEEPDHNQVMILGYDLWQRRFGSDRSLPGKTISFGEKSFTVVGVMPPGFQFPATADYWVPLGITARMKTMFRGNVWLSVIGRFKPGVTRREAQSEMDILARHLGEEFPQEHQGLGINVVPLHEQLVGHLKQSLILLWAAVAAVPLIACVNVANLLLARAAGRRREFAVRAALGASRFRIIQLLLCESLLLVILGGAFGLLLAAWGVHALVALNPDTVPRLNQIGVDKSALIFTVVTSLMAGLLFGLVPALKASRPELTEALKEGGRTITGELTNQRFRHALVISEIALTLVLLIAAGLMIRSFRRLQQVDPGFDSNHLLMLRINLPDAKYPYGSRLTAFYHELEERLNALPGVQSVGATSGIFLDQKGKQTMTVPFLVENQSPEFQTARVEVAVDVVTPGYFKTMGISILKGRAFTPQDIGVEPPVIVINETMARRYWPDGDVIGKRFKFNDPNFKSPWFTIVGVLRDVRRQGLDGPIGIEAYLPDLQNSMEVVIRTASDPEIVAAAARHEIRELDKDAPILNLQTMNAALAGMTAQRRLNTLLLGIFAVIALILATIGIYGVMTYAVMQRTHEIGVRLALGAQPRDVLKLIISQGMALTAIGVAIGLSAALIVTRVMSSLLFGVSSIDPATFAGVPMLFAIVALLACYVPARRAMKIDPMIALRYE